MAGVQWLMADPEDTKTIVSAATGATVVVQALSPVYTHRAWRAGIPRLTGAAIRVTRALGATMLLPASVYNFGAAMPAELHEDTPQNPTTVKGRLRLASERQILQATQDGRMKAVVIRGGDFFGSGTGSWFDLVMVRDLARGRFTYPGALDVPTAWAYLPDMARAFVQVAQQRDRLGAFQTLHFGGYSLTGRQWVDAMTAVARRQGWLADGEPLRVKSVSWTLMRVAGLFVPMLAALSEMRYLWRTPHALRNTRLVELIGQEPHTPLADAVQQAVADLGLGAQAGATPALAAR